MSSYKDEELDKCAPSADEQNEQDAMRALGLEGLSEDEITDEIRATPRSCQAGSLSQMEKPPRAAFLVFIIENMIDLRAIEDVASACRSGLAALRASDRFSHFPRGNCGEAAELVGRLLNERLNCSGKYICGSDHPQLAPTQTHAWFEVNGIVVDITYDQFVATGLSGWVFPTGSSWHASFKNIVRSDVCMPEHWPMYPHEGYSSILQRLAESP